MFYDRWLSRLTMGGIIGFFVACSVYDEYPPVRLNDVGDASFQSTSNSEPGKSASSLAGDSTADAGNGVSLVGGGLTLCGDGLVTGTEVCDIAIAAGKPGACPTVCLPLTPCNVTELRGIGCYTACVPIALGCQGGDGCCPASCDTTNDPDCSVTCGDGIVQTDKGETCEPPSAAASANSLSEALICPTACKDDGDPCTKEMLEGSAKNCNTHCVTLKISLLISGDKCCPHGANANQDSDCSPECGNGVKERGEECDGTAGCDSYCKLRATTDNQKCYETLSDFSDGCQKCLCSNCANEVAGCYYSGEAGRDGECAAIVNCGLDSGCTSIGCYCGTAGIGPLGTCLQWAANGACKREIEIAAGTDDILIIFNQRDDPNTAVGRSTAFSDCHLARCPDAC